MARYIDADLLIKNIVKIPDLRTLSTKTIGEAISNTPTADVEEVKHGYWKRVSNQKVYWYVCSVCGEEMPRNKYGGWSFPSFCPDCGSKMDGGKAE